MVGGQATGLLWTRIWLTLGMLVTIHQMELLVPLYIINGLVRIRIGHLGGALGPSCLVAFPVLGQPVTWEATQGKESWVWIWPVQSPSSRSGCSWNVHFKVLLIVEVLVAIWWWSAPWFLMGGGALEPLMRGLKFCNAVNSSPKDW